MKTNFFNNFVAIMLLSCLLSLQSLLAQSTECGVMGANTQSISIPCMINFASNPYTPIARVRMRFHFLPRLDGRPQFTQAEALNIATSMVSFSNQNLSNLNQANVAGPNGIPQRVQDSRIRFELYSTTGDNGVVVYNNGQTDIPPDNYGTDVVNIVFTYCYNSLPDSTNSCCYNAAVDFNRIDFCNIWTTIKQAPAQEDRARLLVHEMGHILDLDHTFQCGNQCSSIDISPNAECGPNGCNSNCSYGGNNIMSYKPDRNLPIGVFNTALTPCQWEHMLNYIVSNNIPFVVWDCQKSNTPLTVSGGNVTWNDLRLLNVDVIVQSGTTLTINCDVRFVIGCGIQVQSGASLIVNSATITNMCGTQWTGIVSQGNVTLNSATLEHATTSVSRQGGSVTSTSTTFSNNMRDIEYLNKAASPVDIHSGSTFVVNNNYRGSIIRSRVTMWNSQGINFRGCTFDNQYGNPWALSWNAAFDWQGIYAVESNFYVDDLNNNPTTFRNFYAGIRTANLGQNRHAEIRNSRFTDNNAGIISENTNSLIVHKNKFFVNWGSSFSAGEWYRVGLLINTGTGYTVSNNEFIGNLSNGGSGQYIFGTQIIRTGDGEHKLEGNRLDNLYVGHRILGNNTNGSSSTPSGLQLLCTNNSQNIYDHDIENDNDFNGGIRVLQGNTGNPDGNRFSNNGVGPDIWSDALPFVRFFQSSVTNSQASTTVGPVNQFPVTSTSSCSPFVQFLRVPNSDNNSSMTNAQKTASQMESSLIEGSNGADYTSIGNNGVLTEGLSSAQLSELSRDFEEAEAALQAAKRQHTELIDGGNQGQLLSNVRTRWNRDTATLRRSLSALSPNLSTEVLIATAQLNVLSNPTLMQLLKANPSACRSNKLKKVLTQELSAPFSDADFQSLLSISTRGSQRFDIEDAINTHSSRKGEIGRALISGLMTDQDANRDDLRYWWTRIGTRHAQYSLAESYIKDNQSNRYEAQLRNLSRDLTDFDVQMKENEDYVSLYGIKSKVLKSGRSWKQMTSSEIEQVRRIANSTRGDAGVQANNILCYAFGECKPLEVPRFGSLEGIQGLKAQTPNASNAAKSGNQFVAYPNPAHGTIHVDYNLEGKFEDAYISLIDFTGREIKRQKIYANRSQVQWQTEQMQSGLYLITIYADKRLVWQTKISVQK